MEYKWIISFLFLIVVQCVLSAELHGLRSERASKKKGKDCNPWVFEECKAKKGNCGEGKKLGRRTGADCGKTEKVFPCTVPCDGESPSSNQGKNKRGGDKICKYTRGDWSNCDATTNQKSRTLTLRKGDPNSCEKEKVITKSCKRACQYEKGEWSPCDASTKTKQRTLTLKDGSDASCPATKPQTRECKGGENKDCKYSYGDWSACNPSSNMRSKTGKLEKGDSSVCEPTKVVTKNCSIKGGKDRCFFGQWGEYSDCQNGVRKKQRELKFGGADCQKRAVKTKPC